MSRLGLILILALIAAPPSARAGGSAESLFDATAKEGVDHVYNLEFDKAGADFQELIRLQPHRPAGYFFQGMILWWKIMLDIENERYDDEFFAAMDNVVEMCDSILDRNEDDVDAIFFKGGAIGFKGRLKFHRDDYLSAANAGRKALPLVQEAQQLAPGNYDILLGSGIYNYYADVIPQEYPFLKPVLLFIPPGDKKKGIEQLRVAAERGRYAATESAYFLMQVYFYYEKDYPKALELALRLHNRYPANMLFHKYVGRCYVLMNNWQLVEEIFDDVLKRCREQRLGYNDVTEREAEYYLGQCALNRKALDAALGHFFRCDELSRKLDRKGPSGFMVMANMRIGNVYDLQGKRELAVRQYEKVIGWKDYKGSVSTAEQFVKVPYVQ